MQKVYIAADHAGFALKRSLLKQHPEWLDLGPENADRVDYPDFAERLGRQVVQDPGSLGVLICGSGIGMSIAANKISGVRAALVENPSAARLARDHNDANVLCLGSRFLALEYADEIATVFLSTPFSDEPRHAARVKKMNKLEG